MYLTGLELTRSGGKKETQHQIWGWREGAALEKKSVLNRYNVLLSEGACIKI